MHRKRTPTQHYSCGTQTGTCSAFSTSPWGSSPLTCETDYDVLIILRPLLLPAAGSGFSKSTTRASQIDRVVTGKFKIAVARTRILPRRSCFSQYYYYLFVLPLIYYSCVRRRVVVVKFVRCLVRASAFVIIIAHRPWCVGVTAGRKEAKPFK